MYGLISHIQRMSLHDGPGIRTTVFFKGCDLRCRWCHNPETFAPEAELGWAGSKCIRCGVCLAKCPSGALSINGNEIVRNWSACRRCGTCVAECYPNAHYWLGRKYTADELCGIAGEDRNIFERSGGGVTVSGGEPMVQFLFLEEFLKALFCQGFHITLQTNLNASWEKYQAILPFVNYFMCDLKLLDTAAHQHRTGKGNERILENIGRLDASGAAYCLRTPVIPGVNDQREQLQQMHAFVSALKHIDKYELIPFHPLASYKYKNMGIEYPFEKVKGIPQNEFEELRKTFEINR